MKKYLLMLTAMVFVVALATLAAAKPPLEKPLAPFQSNSRATEVEPNDDCTTANALTIGDDMNAAIDPAGDEDWFAFEAMAGDCVIFETHPGDANDTKMWLYDGDCVTELDFDDDGGEGFYSLIPWTFDVAGMYYIRITHYSTTGTGTYILTATACPEPEPNDTCDGAINLQEQGLQLFEVDLCLYNNDYSPALPSCTGYSANGPDAVYSVALLMGETINVCEDPANGYIDLSIWLVSDCGDPENTCVAGDDSGNPECITYTAEADGMYYLMVDAYSGCGMVTVTVDAPVPTDEDSWGTVKSLYR